MAIRILSFDFDGCLFNINFHSSRIKNIIRANLSFLNKIRKQNHMFSDAVTFIGSNRQSHAIDRANSVHNGTGSCFPAIQKVSNYLHTTLDPFLLADIYGDLPDGTAYFLGMRKEYHGEHCDWLFDDSKATIIYAQAHKSANDHPGEALVYDFFDDRMDILTDLQKFYTNFPELLPVNVILRLNHYEEGADTRIVEIKGTGFIDEHYRDTVKDMGGVAVRAMQREDTPDRINSTLHVKPNMLHNRSPKSFAADRAPITDEINYRQQLLVMQRKAWELQVDKHFAAAAVAVDLCAALNKNAQLYFEGTLNVKNFSALSLLALEKAKPMLEKYRGWKEVFGNIALLIAGLGVGYIIAGLINKAATGNFLFFKTDSAHKLDKLQHGIEQIAQPTAAPAA